MRLRGEGGVAIVAASMAMLLLLALGATLVAVTSTETAIAANFRTGGEGLYAAAAVVERAIAEIRRQADWDLLLSGAVESAFADGLPVGPRALPDGTTIDLTQVLNLANCARRSTCSDAAMNATTQARPWGANNPRWVVYAHGRLDDMVGTPHASAFYVVAMVADDGAENDGDPLRDGVEAPPFLNPGRNVLRLRGESFGPRGAHRVVEATLRRYRMDEVDPLSPTRLRLLAWREF